MTDHTQSGDVEPGLFPEPEHTMPPPDLYEGLGQDARRTARNLDRIAQGIHPATHMPLHPDAAPDRTGPGLRCRDCGHLWRKTGYFEGAFWKCDKTIIRHDVQSTGPDIRRWWPACSLFEPKQKTNKEVSEP